MSELSSCAQALAPRTGMAIRRDGILMGLSWCRGRRETAPVLRGRKAADCRAVQGPGKAGPAVARAFYLAPGNRLRGATPGRCFLLSPRRPRIGRTRPAHPGTAAARLSRPMKTNIRMSKAKHAKKTGYRTRQRTAGGRKVNRRQRARHGSF